MTRIFTARRRAQSLQCGVGVLAGNNGEKLAFVGDVQWVEAEQFAGAAHGIVYGNFFLEENNTQAAIARKFVERGGHAAARGIAHPADAGAASRASA